MRSLAACGCELDATTFGCDNPCPPKLGGCPVAFSCADVAEGAAAGAAEGAIRGAAEGAIKGAAEGAAKWRC